MKKLLIYLAVITVVPIAIATAADPVIGLTEPIKEIDLAIAKIDMMKNVSHCKKQLDIIKKQQEKAQKEVDDAMANLKEHNESVEIAEINLQGATDGYNSIQSCFNA